MRVWAGTVVVAALLVGGACSGDDATTDDTTAADPTAPPAAGSTDPSADPTVTRGDDEPTTSRDDRSEASDPTTVPTTEPARTTFPVVEVPETGVPGLDSEDSFCAAWSRFGGTWQVLQVAANFAPDATVVPSMEVAAAPVVGAAYDAMLAAWPDELASERDAVADGFFGPLDRRAEVALAALAGAGATADDLDALAAAWEAALSERQTDEPVLTPELDDGLRTLVAAAAADFAAQRVDFVDDPTMRITVATPLTDAYLATACPDQGALAGGEVEG